jgi:hypothetical protein
MYLLISVIALLSLIGLVLAIEVTPRPQAVRVLVRKKHDQK